MDGIRHSAALSRVVGYFRFTLLPLIIATRAERRNQRRKLQGVRGRKTSTDFGGNGQRRESMKRRPRVLLPLQKYLRGAEFVTIFIVEITPFG